MTTEHGLESWWSMCQSLGPDTPVFMLQWRATETLSSGNPLLFDAELLEW